MPTKKLIPLAAASLLAISTAHASVDLIAIGKISGNIGDLATQTSYTLENGVPGNLFGGIGSGLAYAGCGNFIAVPDRGPNAVSYNGAVDDTVSYINRFQTLSMQLKPAPSGSALPYTLSPTLTATTLMSTASTLIYGTGADVGLPSGVPPINTAHLDYFTGRSDGFVGTQLSTYPFDARFDPESVRVSNDGKSIYVSDEYGPHIYKFNRATGVRTGVIAIPASFAVINSSPVGDDEISNNTSGRLANKGMEGLAISPDGSTLFGAMQSPLIQDGGKSAAYTRILKVDLNSGTTTQYAYPLTNIGSDSKPKYPTISDVVAVNDHQLLVDERDGNGLGDDSTAKYKKLYLIDLSGAQDVTSISGASNLASFAVAKVEFLDVLAALTGAGISAEDVPAKLEGVAFGPDLFINGVPKHTLWIANDNDFLGTITDSNHPNGIDNPNQFFVFSVDTGDLPSYQAQPFPLRSCQ